MAENILHETTKAHKAITWVTGLLTLALATAAFVLSFNNLAALAAEHGVSIPPLFPLVVEAAVIIFSLNAIYRNLNGEGAKMQWALIIGSSILAGAFNIAHAQPDYLSRAMAAMPSLFLLLSFESFLYLTKHHVTRNGVAASIEQLRTQADELRKQNEAADAQHAAILAQVETVKKELAAAKEAAQQVRNQPIDETQRQMWQIDGALAAGASQRQAGELLHISEATVRNRIRNLNGDSLYHRKEGAK